MDLGHRIVAMVEGRPKRVICQTCGSQHNYRAPQATSSGVKRRNVKASSAGGTGASSRATQKAKAEVERVQDWETKVLGQSNNAFTRYAIDRTFEVGDLVLHKKFGEGYVTDVLDANKVSIMFRDGPRTLAQGQS